jgi:hypothetical protein
MVIISIGVWLLDHKIKVSARSAPRPFCSAKLSGSWRNLHIIVAIDISLYLWIPNRLFWQKIFVSPLFSMESETGNVYDIKRGFVCLLTISAHSRKADGSDEQRIC